MTKKKLIYIIIAAVGLLLVSVTTVLVLAMITKNNQDTKQAQITKTKLEADDLKSQAIESNINNDNEKALSLFKTAKEKYTEINDINNIRNIEALTGIIEQTKPSTFQDAEEAITLD